MQDVEEEEEMIISSQVDGSLSGIISETTEIKGTISFTHNQPSIAASTKSSLHI
jgi:hypothetical protein